MDTINEIKELMIRFYDHQSTELFSHQEGVVLIGTDPREWLTDFESIENYFKNRTPGGEENTLVKPGQLIVMVEGSLAWVLDNPRAVLPNGFEIPLRATTVLHREEDSWKIMQHHISAAIPDHEIILRSVPPIK
jgi:hypothetical protein